MVNLLFLENLIKTIKFLIFISSIFCLFTAVAVYVEAFDSLISGPVAHYAALSQKIGGDVQKHVRNILLPEVWYIDKDVMHFYVLRSYRRR